MVHVDLNAARAARAEGRGEPPSITFGDRDYELVHELPVRFVELLRGERLEAALLVLLADEKDVDAFLSNRPTIEDVAEMATAYGLNLGESLASGNSSNGTSNPSRPTSKRTTGSTSAKSSGAKRK